MDSNQKPIAVELINLSIGYKQKQLLDGASATFQTGELTAVLGRNGAGKSTLLRAIAGLNPEYSGKILINGHADLSAMERAREVAYVATRRERLGPMTVEQLVALGRAPMTNWLGSLSAGDHEIVEKAMDIVGIMEMGRRKVDTLSDGEAQRAMIARAIAQETPVILLDEPTSFLDIPAREALAELLKKLSEEGKTVIFTTHELNLALRYSNQIALIDTLRLLTGPPRAMNCPIIEAFGMDTISQIQ